MNKTNPSEIDLLIYITAFPNTFAERIAEISLVTQPAISKKISKLYKSGLIEKQRDRQDKRIVRISLSQLGLKVLQDEHSKSIQRTNLIRQAVLSGRRQK